MRAENETRDNVVKGGASGAVRIVDVAELDLAFEPRPWRFAKTHAASIAAHWERLSAERPTVYNGRVLLMRRWALARRTDGKLRLEGAYFEANYADFVGWRAIGDSGEPILNCLAMAALRGADGAFLLGEMAPHTMSSGQIYFPAGAPDPNDVVDGKVDLDASARRELFEETGIRAEETVVGPAWTVVFAGWRIACMKPMTLTLSAAEAKARIEAFLALDALPELRRIHIIRRASDIDEARTPFFVSAYLRTMLESGGRANDG
ncbi:MAG: NUDIX hydrolase [Hyphomicrobiales bacterium]|nr:NUDIX hydrolase [Hyphomicrobiales bacterium]